MVDVGHGDALGTPAGSEQILAVVLRVQPAVDRRERRLVHLRPQEDVLSEGSGEARGERVSVPCLAEGVCENSSQRTMSAAFDADQSDRVEDDGSAHTASLPVFFPRLRRP